jgi:hypothetical protein
MTKLVSSALGLALLCASVMTPRADDKDKIDVTGTWACEVEIGGNQGSPVFTFKQEGERLTGKYKGQFGEAKVTGSVKGNKIEFSFQIENGGKVVYTGTIEEKDMMKGKCDYADQASGTWTGKRQKSDK